MIVHWLIHAAPQGSSKMLDLRIWAFGRNGKPQALERHATGGSLAVAPTNTAPSNRSAARAWLPPLRTRLEQDA